MSDFKTISQKWSPYWDDMSRATFGSLPWRSQHDIAAKSCLAHNFVIWSRILQIFHRNDHHIETMCCAQHLGCFYSLNFLWHNSDTTRDIPSCVQNLFREHHPVQLALVLCVFVVAGFFVVFFNILLLRI
jgi:hypothetical protein